MKTFCVYCGAEKYVNGMPGVKDGDDSHGTCPVCYIRIVSKKIKSLDNKDSESEEITEEDTQDLRSEVERSLTENAEWIGDGGVPVLDKDPELKEIYEKLKAEVIAERSSEGSGK